MASAVGSFLQHPEMTEGKKSNLILENSKVKGHVGFSVQNPGVVNTWNRPSIYIRSFQSSGPFLGWQKVLMVCGWRDDLVVKCTCCSCTGPKFGS